MLPNTIIPPVGQPFIELITVDSTNNYAMAQLQQGEVQDGTVWFAHSQTAGRGQRGRQWLSQPGKNIALSAALNTNGLAVSRQFYLSMAVALATHDTISKYVNSESCVKWPNDIYINDRKAGGILIENIIRGDKWQWAVAGIGLNINQTEFDAGALRPVSLAQVTGRQFDVQALARELCTALTRRYEQFLKKHEQLTDEYNAVLYRRGKTVRLKRQNIVFDAKIKEVTPDGMLHVEGAMWDAFAFGEVEWVID
ncbi:MAG TPA: biotin--[acetyl-CoA-carboxylase] ligase [Chitinophagaceae bacterium]|nr:biotin--[acetyl-CoA-carboxylase] ligase [Chitinophagaceae bacterium]